MIDIDLIIRLKMVHADKSKNRLASEPVTSISDLVNQAINKFIVPNEVTPEFLLSEIESEGQALKYLRCANTKDFANYIISMFNFNGHSELHEIFKPLLDSENWQKEIYDQIQKRDFDNYLRKRELERLIGLKSNPRTDDFPMDLPAANENAS